MSSADTKSNTSQRTEQRDVNTKLHDGTCVHCDDDLLLGARYDTCTYCDGKCCRMCEEELIRCIHCKDLVCTLDEGFYFIERQYYCGHCVDTLEINQSVIQVE